MNALAKSVRDVIAAEPKDVSAPKCITPAEVRELAALIQKQPGFLGKEAAQILTSHFFCDGIYMREFFLPSGALVVGKIHRNESFFQIVVGEATISTADGSVRRLKAPYISVTQPGGQRVVAAHQDTVFLTFHANPDNCRDIATLEERLSVPEQDEPMEQIT